MPLTNLGWKSGEGYDAVQDTVTGQRYYRTPAGMYLDPQTGAQVQPPAAASAPVGYTPAPQPTPQPQPMQPPQQAGPISFPTPAAGPMRFDGGAPQYAPDPNDPNRQNLIGFGQGGGPGGYPQMPGYPGQGGSVYTPDQSGNTDADYIAWIQSKQGPGMHTMEFRPPPPGFQQRHPEYSNPEGGLNFQGGQQGGQQQGGGGLTSLGWKSEEGYDAVQGADGKRYYRTANGQFLDPATGAQVTPSGMSPQYAGGMTPGGPKVAPGGPMRFDGGQQSGGMENRGWPGAYAGQPGGQTRTLYGGPAQTYTGQQPNGSQSSTTMPNVPLPYQVNPAVWDSLSRTGRGLALGAAGAGGWDKQDYEDQINATRPQGYARQASSYGYQTPKSDNRGGF